MIPCAARLAVNPVKIVPAGTVAGAAAVDAAVALAAVGVAAAEAAIARPDSYLMPFAPSAEWRLRSPFSRHRENRCFAEIVSASKHVSQQI